MRDLVKRLLRRTGARRYISDGISVSDFLEELHVKKVNYVVLRWYESLPEVAPGEDIDILVADEDVSKLKPLLKGKKGRHQPVDLYSVSGLPGSAYNRLPYYQPEIAKDILNRSVIWSGLCRVPSPRDAFLSMAYHVVYHKGHSSGVPASGFEVSSNEGHGDHDYVSVLLEKAGNAGIQLELNDINLARLDELLGEAGWRPSIETLTKLSVRNLWLSEFLSINRDDSNKALSPI